MFQFLDKQNSIAPAGFNRWRVLPAALCIHLSIGQVYAWSVFNKPLTKLIGITEPAQADWAQSTVILTFSLAIVCLGLAAAFGGKWLERAGPRQAMFVSAVCFASGLFVSAAAVRWHSIALLYAGYGVLGGIGLGLGYISPVSTLLKWFPDRPGMATGLAIMGFGGGAIVAAPLSTRLMTAYQSPTDTGVAATFATLGAIYLVMMLVGASIVRIPPVDWKPIGYEPQSVPKKMTTTRHVHADDAIETPQFYLLWVMLCFNVSAGIAILGKASDLIQEVFGVSADGGKSFVMALGISNMLGRFLWSSVSDYLGRQITYGIFFGLGLVLYALLPTCSSGGYLIAFVAANLVIMSMYGGGFATIPAYLRDVFGTMHVGAIHGRLLTAWSVAGVLGPYLLTKWAETQKQAGVSLKASYDHVLYFMAALLFVGFLCNRCMSPVHESRYYGDANDSP